LILFLLLMAYSLVEGIIMEFLVESPIIVDA
jgi:hypothetical protein